jgi:hypothetical protein
MTVFCDVAMCKLVEVDQTAWCSVPEDSNFHACCCENLKSHPLIILITLHSIYLSSFQGALNLVTSLPYCIYYLIFQAFCE